MTDRQRRWFHGRRDRAPLGWLWRNTATGTVAHLVVDDGGDDHLTICGRIWMSSVEPRDRERPCNQCLKRWEEANL